MAVGKSLSSSGLTNFLVPAPPFLMNFLSPWVTWQHSWIITAQETSAIVAHPFVSGGKALEKPLFSGAFCACSLTLSLNHFERVVGCLMLMLLFACWY